MDGVSPFFYHLRFLGVDFKAQCFKKGYADEEFSAWAAKSVDERVNFKEVKTRSYNFFAPYSGMNKTAILIFVEFELVIELC